MSVLTPSTGLGQLEVSGDLKEKSFILNYHLHTFKILELVINFFLHWLRKHPVNPDTCDLQKLNILWSDKDYIIIVFLAHYYCHHSLVLNLKIKAYRGCVHINKNIASVGFTTTCHFRDPLEGLKHTSNS